MQEKNKHFGKGKMEDFKVKKDKKIRRKERRQNKNIKNWHIEEIEDSYDFNVIYDGEDEKIDKY
jgi:hypothetical protein